MSEYASKQDFVKLEAKLDQRFDDLTALMSNFANQTNDKFDIIDQRFDAIDRRFDFVDQRFDAMDKRIDKVETRFDNRFDLLTNVIDGYASKIDTYAQEMAAMDHKINRLEKYIQILADNAGIDLDKIHA